MTDNSKETGAARSNAIDWDSIDWTKAERNTRRLQAYREGDESRQMGEGEGSAAFAWSPEPRPALALLGV